MTGLVVIIAIVVLLLAVFYGWYMALIKRRNGALEALSSIDVQLRKRFDLLPNVLKIASRFMQHERELFNQITAQRAAAMKDYDPKDPEQVRQHLEAAGAVRGSMMQLFAVAENYPDLKSDQTMVTAQHTAAEVEGNIAAARRFYNAAVTRLNNSVQIFPGNVIAGIAGVQVMPFFREEEEAAKAPIDAAALLN